MEIIFASAKKFSGAFGFSRLFPQAVGRNLSGTLAQAGQEMDGGAYLSFAVFTSVISFLAFLAASLAFLPAVEAAVFSLLFSASSFAFLFSVPFLAKNRRTQELEAELPIALRALALTLSLDARFETALRDLCAGYGAFSGEMRRVCQSVERGASVPSALASLSSRTDSLALKRACAQLSFSYCRGFRTDGLRKLAEELSSVQRTRSREYAAKTGFAGLFFITVSCVVPALFGAYVIVGSAVLDLSFTSRDVLLAFALFFPLLDALVLAYLRLNAPVVLG